ncbi:hypothetical protein [Streptomyces californicus]|uniref:hypothetical protein n=1 Tax=Streptomyces californicus TaxID=67351 RepID=UPI0004C05D98|nr:hypothetical protein [Streptomyces californicus]QRV53457.1 hypothetical protein I6J40_04050 [Streptomyces californicus]
MTEYIAQCRAGRYDKIVARVDGDSVELAATSHGAHKMETYLDTADARTFARGILALADEVDGGEVEPAEDSRPKVGDLLRVTKDYPRHAPVKTGDVITVSVTDYDSPGGREDHVRFTASGDGPNDYQWFVPLSAVEPVIDEPVAPTTTAVTTPTREAHLRLAAELMGDNPYSARSLIELADYLAGENA